MLLFTVTPALMTVALVKGMGIGLVAGVVLARAYRCQPRATDKPAA